MRAVGIHSFLCAVALTLATSASVLATNVDDARTLLRNGELDAALERLQAHLPEQPDDVQARFLKGVVLAEQQDANAAIAVFQNLTTDFPDLPEPYNNLAVLYAANGDYERARDALLVAIGTHPSYATAHENLGDIYAKMAGIVYDKALEFDGHNSSARSKLGLLSELFSVSGNVAGAVAVATPEPEGDSIEVVSSSDTNVAISSPGLAEQVVVETVFEWAAAWSKQDVDTYLSFYGVGFSPPGGMARDAWESQRRVRLLKPDVIEVDVEDVSVEMRAGDRADVEFAQGYRSDTYQDQVRKRLRMAWDGFDWKIIGEQEVQ